jgi:hypothetical protein
MMQDYREVWAVDFEYRSGPGERPWPLCMSAIETRSGREIRMWRDQLLALRHAPFDTGSDTLFVAYYASAELGCFLQLDWELPTNVLDLYVEHRHSINGTPEADESHSGLVWALALRGLPHMEFAEKDRMRRLIIEHTAWSDEERSAILEYCAEDVRALGLLLPAMAPEIDLPRALLRGRYMGAVARMEHTGTPIDTDLHAAMVENWGAIKNRLIADIDANFGVFEDGSFRACRFEAWLAQHQIIWPRLPSGELHLKESVFRDMANTIPDLVPLHQLRATLGEMRLTGLHVGSDGRNRCMLSPFRSVTSRNQPSNTRYIFGPASWMRGLIKPEPGTGIAYVDWVSQEIAIAAALSKDERMMKGYVSGDPYLAFAKAAGLAPPDATKDSHKAIRDRCKSLLLGISYGMGQNALALSAGISVAEARELLRLHRNTYSTFWRWSDNIVDAALIDGGISTVFGWRRRITGKPNERSLMNFPMQGNASEMMRLAAIGATEAGIRVCAPVHDAFVIESPLETLEETVAAMRHTMAKASKVICGGLEIRTDAEIVTWPGRYMDPKGADMWCRIVGMLPA